jgi:hypothetical protein
MLLQYYRALPALHYPGKTCALPRLNNQVEMVSHHREIIDPERVALFRFRDDVEKQRFRS